MWESNVATVVPTPPLKNLDDDKIQNIYIYVGDAVRWDSVPDRILNKGISIKTVAAGIHSPTSIATIVSGTYLPQHQVQNFSDQMPPDVPSLLDISDINVAFINSINDVRFDPNRSESIIADTLQTTNSDPSVLEDISEPFFVLERGPGGHAPYIRTENITDGKEYFESRGNAKSSKFRTEYNTAVSEDADWFLSRIKTLESRGLLDETLVIYMSDHGELLGENGMMAHSPPIHPAHVYVPSVFIHPSLQTQVIRERVASHVDIAPTIFSLLNVDANATIKPAGKSLINEELSSRGASFHDYQKPLPYSEITFKFDSAWGATGGYVLPRSSRLSQMIFSGYRLTQVPWRAYAFANIRKHLSFQLRGRQQYGTPSFTLDDAEEYIQSIKKGSVSKVATDEVDIPTERLEELGYIE